MVIAIHLLLLESIFEACRLDVIPSLRGRIINRFMPWGTGYTSDSLETLVLANNFKGSVGPGAFDYTKVINEDLMQTVNKVKLLDYADKTGLGKDCIYPFPGPIRTFEFIEDKPTVTLAEWKSLLLLANENADKAALKAKTSTILEYSEYKAKGGLDEHSYRFVAKCAADKIDTLENFKFRKK
jgi:hypothetical protein